MDILIFIGICFPLVLGGHTYDHKFDPRSYYWSTTAQCSQEFLPIKTARRHFGQGLRSFECVAFDRNRCEIDNDDDAAIIREHEQYGSTDSPRGHD